MSVVSYVLWHLGNGPGNGSHGQGNTHKRHTFPNTFKSTVLLFARRKLWEKETVLWDMLAAGKVPLVLTYEEGPKSNAPARWPQSR